MNHRLCSSYQCAPTVLVAALAAFAAACAGETGLVGPGLVAPSERSPLPVDDVVQIDVVLQVVNPITDMLWVLDNSPSMASERDALSDAIPYFIDPFHGSGVDYHIGVVTTDMESDGHQGRLREALGHRWIDPDTPGATSVFRIMATDATAPSTKDATYGEYGAMAALQALTDKVGAGRANHGFYRTAERTAYLHITVVTDEDDDSHQLGLPPESFAAWMLGEKALPTRTSFNSVVSWVDQRGNQRGDDYLLITDLVGGEAQPLHTVDWPEFLSHLGGTQAPPAATEFFLSRIPVVSTIEVRARTSKGVTLAWPRDDGHWTYSVSRNSVQFIDDAPPLGSAVQVEYAVRAAQPVEE